jgi:class 3 adenylate cyclase
MSQQRDPVAKDDESLLTVGDLIALVETSREISETIKLSELVHRILMRASELTSSPDSAVMLHNPERESLFFAGATGAHAAKLLDTFGEFSEQQIPLQGSKAGQVFQTRRAVVVDHVQEDPEHYKGVDRTTKRATQSMVCVPLVSGSKCLGVVQILNKTSGNYTTKDQQLLEYFAAQAAVAISNSQLIEKLAARMGLYGATKQGSRAIDMLEEFSQPARSERLTVLFADMRGFTRFCQVLSDPTRVQRHLNEFLTMLADCVTSNGGIANKFMGDGLLALFRESDHETRAVRAAFDMTGRFDDMRRRWDEKSNECLDFVDIGIGVTTDDMIIGPIGSHAVRDFTVMGSAVNLAAGFEHSARAGRRILVDQQTFNAARPIVRDFDVQEPFLLQKADQDGGNFYKVYNLKALESRSDVRIYLSHSHADREWVETQLARPLIEASVDVWYTGEESYDSDERLRTIYTGLEKCHRFVVIVSARSASSDWVRREVHLAHCEAPLSGRMLVVRLDETHPADISPLLSSLPVVDGRDAGGLHTAVMEWAMSRDRDEGAGAGGHGTGSA